MSASGSPAPACPLCASHDHTEILRITQPDRFERAAGVSAPGYLRTWYECRGCGLLINVGPPFDRAQVYGNTYYDRSIEKESVAERYARIMALPPSKSDNYLRAARVRDEILSLDGSRPGWRRNLGQVLDVGAGSGVFLARFQQLASDWQCTAIEPNPDACEHLRTLPGIQVVGNFFAPDIFSERFELVTLNKVLEHVQDPVTFLSGVGEVLAPRGVVYVELPDKVTARCRPPTDNILGALHYHLYDPHTVTLLMRRAGVVPLSVQRYAEPSGKISVCGFGCTDALLLHIGGVA